VRSRWDDGEAMAFEGPIGQRVYTSRLLGSESSLVLHGGGNTSVKTVESNLFGEPEPVLYLKGSGRDLRTIDADGFAPLRLESVLRLCELASLSDVDMGRELRRASKDPDGPQPSVEALLHASIPATYVDHSHADAVLAITNTEGGEARIREIYGDDVVVMPYMMPGFRLAKAFLDGPLQEIGERTLGVVLLHHGLITFGESARASYERTIDLVDRAEAYLERKGAWALPRPATTSAGAAQRVDLARLRADLSRAAGRPMIVRAHQDPLASAFARRDDLAAIAQQGPVTPDHVIRTKRLPLLGRDVDGYVAAYRAYVADVSAGEDEARARVDPAPRVVLDPELGVLAVGVDVEDATITGDLYRHTIEVVLRATALGGYRSLPASDVFDVEYWYLEQAKLRRPGSEPEFRGEVALVTGAASGIGKACVASLLARGAAVVGLDLQPAIETTFEDPAYLGLVCDVTDEAQVEAAFERTARAFGGLDMLVLNAGIFPPAKPVVELETATWRRVLGVNLDANLTFLRHAHPLLAIAPRRGRVVVIGSKNVPAPGPGAAAYSASKAAMNQLARVVALEWARDGIRINSVHPDAVFDTALWTEELLASRAKHYGMTVEAYKRKNLLRVEVTSRHVAEMAAAMCGSLFECTTAGQLPIDGGNERVI
jgi:rhamnose utilization protein RhaD (predicted bifunctional aldolase and dehydrogenase)/NAD(P)-dependent dehydrogenase (short-subunit alcohol dehydrogenase family)